MLKFFENKLLQTPCGAVWRPETMTSAVIVHQFELVDMPPFSFFTFYAFHRILSLFIPLFPLYYFIALFSSLFLFFLFIILSLFFPLYSSFFRFFPLTNWSESVWRPEYVYPVRLMDMPSFMFSSCKLITPSNYQLDDLDTSITVRLVDMPPFIYSSYKSIHPSTYQLDEMNRVQIRLVDILPFELKNCYHILSLFFHTKFKQI